MGFFRAHKSEGGVHEKYLTKADITVNIYAFIKAQETNKVVEPSRAIYD